MSDYNATVTTDDDGNLAPWSRVTVDGVVGELEIPVADEETGSILLWDRVYAALAPVGLMPAMDASRNHRRDGRTAHFRAVPKETS